MTQRRTDIDDAILANPSMSNGEIAKKLGSTRAQVWRSRKRLIEEGRLSANPDEPSPEQKVDHDLKLHKLKTQGKDTSAKYRHAVKQIEMLEKSLESALQIMEPTDITPILPREGSGSSQATAVWLLSDTHLEEKVTLAQTNGLNEFNLEIAEARMEQYFQRAVRLTEIFGKDVEINNVVLAILGDIITNYLHESSADDTYLGPVEASLFAKRLIIAGIEYVLEHTDYDLTVVCHSGNHGRLTKKSAWGLENLFSLEFFVYSAVRDWFANHKHADRVEFHIPDGMMSYINVYDYTIRFLHGHGGFAYRGGIGGLGIPANKAIARWDKGRRANFTCFGHYHMALDNANAHQGFICNGSLIGYNAYAVAIGASSEPPAQLMFLIDKKRGKTITCPILFDR